MIKINKIGFALIFAGLLAFAAAHVYLIWDDVEHGMDHKRID